MERSRIQEVLQSNVDHTVEDGSRSTVLVITVDDEGFVYDLIPPNAKTAFWSTFEEVLQVVLTA
jgi:hypothetical protein